MIAQLRKGAADYNTADPGYGFTGDPLHSPGAAYYGFLTRDGSAGPPPPQDTTPPSAPTELTAAGGDARVTLNWKANTADPDLAGYRVYRGSTLVGSPTASTFTDAGLLPGTTYAYQVRAVDTSGNPSDAAQASATTWAVANYQPASYVRIYGTVYNGLGDNSRLFSNDGQRVEITSQNVSGSHRSEIEARATIASAQRANLKQLSILYDGNLSSSSGSLRLLVYNYATAGWEQVYGPVTGVTSDRTVTWTAIGVQTDYVGTGGLISFRVRGTRSSSFRTRTDQIRFTVKY
jgi:hypothetical protein